MLLLNPPVIASRGLVYLRALFKYVQLLVDFVQLRFDSKGKTCALRRSTEPLSILISHPDETYKDSALSRKALSTRLLVLSEAAVT